MEISAEQFVQSVLVSDLYFSDIFLLPLWRLGPGCCTPPIFFLRLSAGALPPRPAEMSGWPGAAAQWSKTERQAGRCERTNKPRRTILQFSKLQSSLSLLSWSAFNQIKQIFGCVSSTRLISFENIKLLSDWKCQEIISQLIFSQPRPTQVDRQIFSLLQTKPSPFTA